MLHCPLLAVDPKFIVRHAAIFCAGRIDSGGGRLLINAVSRDLQEKNSRATFVYGMILPTALWLCTSEIVEIADQHTSCMITPQYRDTVFALRLFPICIEYHVSGRSASFWSAATGVCISLPLPGMRREKCKGVSETRRPLQRTLLVACWNK